MRKMYLVIIAIIFISFGILAINLLKSEQPQNSALQNKTKENKGVDLITDAQYFKAIKALDRELASEPRVIEQFTTKEPRVSQLYINKLSLGQFFCLEY